MRIARHELRERILEEGLWYTLVGYYDVEDIEDLELRFLCKKFILQGEYIAEQLGLDPQEV